MILPRNTVVLSIFLIFLNINVLYAEDKLDALSEYRSGRFASAMNICKVEITENPQNLESHVVLCWSLLKLSRHNEALQYAAAAQAISRYDVRVIEILGEIAYQQGRNKDAMQYFQEYINLAPDGQRVDVVFYYEGEIFIRLSRFRHADIALTTALHYTPQNALWWTRLGWARENAGDVAEAILAYEKALSLNPDSSDALRGRDRVKSAINQRN
ncbi:MAG: tetratricopeptide repeat protein [Termitinemataceae bacterium]|nr:MAG: tetratricopeptide repeat protein [Termitinemataceae bacterium]